MIFNNVKKNLSKNIFQKLKQLSRKTPLILGNRTFLKVWNKKGWKRLLFKKTSTKNGDSEQLQIIPSNSKSLHILPSHYPIYSVPFQVIVCQCNNTNTKNIDLSIPSGTNIQPKCAKTLGASRKHFANTASLSYRFRVPLDALWPSWDPFGLALGFFSAAFKCF